MRRVGQVLTLLVLLALGIWLLARPGQPAPGTGARQANLQRAYSPAANTSNVGSTPIAVQGSVAVEPAEPVLVDITAAPEPEAVAADSQVDLLLPGEIDLDREVSRISEVEMAKRREASLARPPDTNVQLSSDAISLLPPVTQSHFAAIDSSDYPGSVPPDPVMAAGNNHLLVAVNVYFAIYDKNGRELLRRLPGSAFQQSSCTTNSALFDPNVLYDEEADRWIVAYAVGPLTSTGGYCMLVSTSGDPLGTWYSYFFRLNSASGWLDFPQAGVGDNHIFMSGNIFSAYSFWEAVLYAFPKADLYAGRTVTLKARGLGSNTNYFAPQPLRLHGYPQGTWPGLGDNHYFLVDDSRWNQSTQEYQLYYALMSWNPVADSLALIKRHDFGTSGSHIYVPQLNGDPVEANDIRPLDFEYRNGYGWATMTVGCNPGSGTVNCIRWAQLDLASGEIGPQGSGVLTTNGQHRFFPDLAVNQCGDMAIGYSIGSSVSWPSIAYTGRRGDDPPGLLRGEKQLVTASQRYTSFETLGTTKPARRWGDYTAMTVDPDGLRFWYVGEYSTPSTATTNWGTYVASLLLSRSPACAEPTVAQVFVPIVTR